LDRTSRVKQLNDAARSSLAGCRILITPGVKSLNRLAAVFEAVQQFSEFTADNDPYDEHDFGSFAVAGQRLFWKFDYYDTTMQMASPDPADGTVTSRVLTIMLAEEY